MDWRTSLQGLRSTDLKTEHLCVGDAGRLMVMLLAVKPSALLRKECIIAYKQFLYPNLFTGTKGSKGKMRKSSKEYLKPNKRDRHLPCCIKTLVSSCSLIGRGVCVGAAEYGECIIYILSTRNLTGTPQFERQKANWNK